VRSYLRPWSRCRARAASPAGAGADAIFNRTVALLHTIARERGRDEVYRGNFLGFMHVLHEGNGVLRYARFGKGWYFRAHSIAVLLTRLVHAHPSVGSFSLLINLSDNPMVSDSPMVSDNPMVPSRPSTTSPSTSPGATRPSMASCDGWQHAPPLLLSFGTGAGSADVPIPDFSFESYLDANVDGYWHFEGEQPALHPTATSRKVLEAWRAKRRALYWRGAAHNLKSDLARRTLVDAIARLQARQALGGQLEARQAMGGLEGEEAAPRIEWDVHFARTDEDPPRPSAGDGRRARARRRAWALAEGNAGLPPAEPIWAACESQLVLTMLGIGFSARDKFLLGCGSVLVRQRPAGAQGEAAGAHGEAAGAQGEAAGAQGEATGGLRVAEGQQPATATQPAHAQHLLPARAHTQPPAPCVREWHEPLLLEGREYVSVSHDGADLESTLRTLLAAPSAAAPSAPTRAAAAQASGEAQDSERAGMIAVAGAAFARAHFSERAVLEYLRELVRQLHARGLGTVPAGGASAFPWAMQQLPQGVAAMRALCVELTHYGSRLDRRETVRCSFESGRALGAEAQRGAGAALGDQQSRAPFRASSAVECCARCRALPAHACGCFEFDLSLRVCTLAHASQCPRAGGFAARARFVAGLRCVDSVDGPPARDLVPVTADHDRAAEVFVSSSAGGFDDGIEEAHVEQFNRFNT
jgi:hypothetical protein